MNELSLPAERGFTSNRPTFGSPIYGEKKCKLGGGVNDFNVTNHIFAITRNTRIVQGDAPQNVRTLR